MGHYTELKCRLKLRKDTPAEVVDLLKRVCIDGDLGTGEAAIFTSEDVFKVAIPHAFFDCSRWYMLLLSRNFDSSKKGGNFSQNSNGVWVLSLDTEFKNYANELSMFFDWITPYIAPTRKKIVCLGQWNYEDNYGAGFNIYLVNGNIEMWAHSKKQALEYQKQTK